MSFNEMRYSLLAKSELDKDINSLAMRNIVTSASDELEVVMQGRAIRECINLAVRLQLIDFTTKRVFVQRLNEILLAKLSKERAALFKELVINPNDDVVTERERIFDIRESDSLSLDQWKNVISNMRDNYNKGQCQSEVNHNTIERPQR